MTAPYRPDNPFAQQGAEARSYRPDNPFAETGAPEPEKPSFVDALRRAGELVDRYRPSAIGVRIGQRMRRDIAQEPLDVPRQVGRGLAESGLAVVRGVETLTAPTASPATYDRFGEYRPAVPEPPVRSTMGQRLTEEVRDFYGEPKTLTGTVAGVGARIAGDVAQYATPGAALQAAKIAAPVTLASRIGLQVATGAPITAAVAAAGPEESLAGGLAEMTGSERLRRIAADPATRIGFDVAVDAILAGAVEGVAALVRRSRAVRQAAVEAGKSEVATTVKSLEDEAAQLSILKTRTPEQAGRLREISGQLQAAEVEVQGTPPLAESRAAQAEVPEPLPSDVMERERRRAQVSVEAERRAGQPAILSRAPAVQSTESPAAEIVPRMPQEPRSAPSAAPGEGARSPKYRKMDDPALEARYAQILDRMSQKSQEAGEGITPWVRKEETSQFAGRSRGFGGYSNATGVHSGTAVTGKAGRAIGRLKDDGRIAAELEAEMAARGIDHDAVLERYLSQETPAPPTADISDEAWEMMFPSGGKEKGAVHPRLAAALARAGVGGTTGAAVGAQVGETPAERRRNAILGALAGGTIVAAAPSMLRSARDRRGIVATLPEIGEQAQRAFGVTPPPRRGGGAPAASDIDPDEYVNVAKFALDPSGEQRLRDEVVSVVQATGMHPKERVPWTETKRVAATLGLRPSDLTGGDAARLNGAELLAIRNIISTNIDQTERLAQRLADANLPGELRERLEQQIGMLEAQSETLLERFIQGRSQAGRNLNSLRILANRTLDPATWLAKTKRLTGDAGFTQEVRANVLRLINEGDRAGLVRYLADVRKASWFEKLITIWKAGLLTNPKTHAVNLTSNTTMAVLETAKDNPAVLWDRLLSLHTGQITKAPTTLRAVRASFDGARRGAREAVDVLRGRPMADALQKFDIPLEVNYDNAFLDTYTKTVFRLLDASDRVFRGAALRRSLAEQATVLARAEGLRGELRTARIAELLASPTDEMATTAIHDAEVATFRDRTALGEIAGGAVRRVPALGFILPFTRTPSAVAARVFEYSPFGFLKGGNDAVRLWRLATQGAPAETIRTTQRRAAEVLGRASTGSAAILVGLWLYEKGLATGAVPMGVREREQWRTEGKQANAILIDGQWHNVGRLSPLGNLIALGANMGAMIEADPNRSPVERLSELAAATVRTVADQPFVTGIRTAVEAVVNPEDQAGRFATNLAGSVVPAGVAAIARGVDPAVRVAEGPVETIKSRIPGVSSSLPARRNVFGEPLERTGGLVGAALDPTSPQRDVRRDDPLVAELSRINAAIGPLKREPDEGAADFERRQILYGRRTRERLERLVRSAAYRRAEVERQREMVEDTVTDIRRTLSRRLSPRRRRPENTPGANQ